MVKKLKFPFLNFIVIQKGNIVEMTIFFLKKFKYKHSKYGRIFILKISYFSSLKMVEIKCTNLDHFIFFKELILCYNVTHFPGKIIS